MNNVFIPKRSAKWVYQSILKQKSMKKFFLLSITSLLIICSCENNKTNTHVSAKSSNVEKINDEYIEKYAGGYEVEVKGISSYNSVEVYILRKDGSAKWMYILNDGNGGANVDSEKDGKWEATKTSITIDINGNTGLITEKFNLKDGEFYDDLTGARKLQLKR